MATPLKVESIETLGEYTAFVEAALARADGIVWFRGVGQESHKLVPSLYRHPIKRTIEEFRDLEVEIINRFRQRCVPYLTRPVTELWDYLFLMQHFGVPTRLLDWSENPYIGLYFALSTALRDVATGDYSCDAAVWVLSPVPWNQRALHHLRVGSILSSDDGRLDGYAPAVEMRLMNSEPVAMYGTHNSPRIVAQRGSFTIFGRNILPMEETYRDLDFPQDSLMKIVLPKEKLDVLLTSLVRIGFSDSVVFPDLDGLAKETKRLFGYRV